MKLTDLDPEFIRWDDRALTPEEAATTSLVGERLGGSDFSKVHTFIPRVEALADAQGVEFDCPVCTCNRSHRIAVAFRDRGVLPHQATRDKQGNPTRWAVSGTGLDDLTLQPSVDCTPSNAACWHGHITNGQVT